MNTLDLLHRRLDEACEDLWSSLVDPAEACWGDDELPWLPLGAGRFPHQAPALPATELDLARIRADCRALAALNEFAINGHENRINFIVGTGHSYRVAPRQGRSIPDDVVRAAQDVIDDFVEENRWQARQQEIVRRRDRDGEAFLRFFVDRDGRTQVRFVEPDQVSTPADRAGHSAASFGIQTRPGDVERVLGYYVDGQLVPRGEVQHRKANVDANVKRGLPLFFPVRRNLRRAEKLLRNMSTVAEIQTAIALIRKHHGRTAAGVHQFVASQAGRVTEGSLARVPLLKRYAPGTILDADAGVDYDFPAAGLNAASYVAVLQAELRAIASRLVMPEFMLTSDASNANYASTMVAEGPALKMFARLQAEQMADDRLVMQRVLENAEAGGRLPAGTLPQVEVCIKPPPLGVRDDLRDAQVYRIMHERQILSPQTWSQLRGLDYEREQANWRAHAADRTG